MRREENRLNSVPAAIVEEVVTVMAGAAIEEKIEHAFVMFLPPHLHNTLEVDITGPLIKKLCCDEARGLNRCNHLCEASLSEIDGKVCGVNDNQWLHVCPIQSNAGKQCRPLLIALHRKLEFFSINACGDDDVAVASIDELLASNLVEVRNGPWWNFFNA